MVTHPPVKEIGSLSQITNGLESSKIGLVEELRFVVLYWIMV
jgi:hypothetical protein